MAAYLGLKEQIADKPCTDTVSFQPKLTVSPESQAMHRIIVEKINVRDTSEQKKLEAMLLRAQKLEGMVNLTRNFAHDFNNILQPISGYAQILSMNKDNSDPDYRKLEMILRSVRKGEELIKQLLTNVDELVKNQN